MKTNLYILIVFLLSVSSMESNVSPEKRDLIKRVIVDDINNQSKHVGAYLMSRCGFHLLLALSHIRYNTGCTFDIVSKQQSDNNISIKRDENGAIVDINDGLHTPLLLGSIPCKEKYIQKIKDSCNLNADDFIEILSLNRQFELGWSGLSKLVDSNKSLYLNVFPTTDFTAPRLIDLIEAVDFLMTRDERYARLVYVHCKSGVGRSATVVSAYFMAVLHEIGVSSTANEIEAYLKTMRPQVHLSKEQKETLDRFSTLLQHAKHFCDLYVIAQDASDR